MINPLLLYDFLKAGGSFTSTQMYCADIPTCLVCPLGPNATYLPTLLQYGSISCRRNLVQYFRNNDVYEYEIINYVNATYDKYPELLI